MHIPRLLHLLLLMSVCIAPVAAQSSPEKISPDKSSPPDKIAVFSQPQLDGLTAPPEFRTQVPALSRRALDGISANQSSPRLHSDPFQVLPFVKPGQSDTTCYVMRTYRVIRDDPDSDTTRPAGYSTCQLASRYQTKDAVILLEGSPR
jgi:hypothetical protein